MCIRDSNPLGHVLGLNWLHRSHEKFPIICWLYGHKQISPEGHEVGSDEENNIFLCVGVSSWANPSICETDCIMFKTENAISLCNYICILVSYEHQI